MIETPAQVKSFLQDDTVIIVWTEDYFINFSPQIFGPCNHQLYIVINPTKGGLYRVKILPAAHSVRLLRNNRTLS